MRHRVVGIIIKDGNILLMHRLKNGHNYYVFPGGGVEENENFEEALRREMKEELSIDIENQRLIFELENQLKEQYSGYMIGYPNEHYFLIENFSGSFELSGPEKERMNNQNKYLLELVDIKNVGEIENLYPRKAVERLLEFLRSSE